MQTVYDAVDAGKFCTPKERFYYAVVVLISIAGWVWIFYSVYKQFAPQAVSTPPLGGVSPGRFSGQMCYVRVTYTDYTDVIKISREELLEGEQCLSREDLTAEELTQAEGSARVSEASEAAELSAKARDLASLPARFSKTAEAITTPIFLILLFLFSLFSHLFAMAFIRMNGVKVGIEQFPEIYEGVGRLSARLGIKKQPDTFVINGEGVLNAFATRLVFRRLLVIYSNLAEALIDGKDQRELEAVLGHELGHHALGHTHVLQWLLFPGMLIPGIGSALSRAREYSCDRIMKALIVSKEPCERALVKLAAGKVLGERVNVETYLEQPKQEGGFFAWLAEVLSTHPHLPKRVAAIRRE